MASFDDISFPRDQLSPMDRHMGRIIRAWAETEVMPRRRRYDEDWAEHALIEPAMRKLMGELGLQRMLFPEDLGGMGFGRARHLGTSSFRILEEVARADSGIAVAFGVLFWPLLMITRRPHENRRLCEEFAPLFCSTTRAVYAANAMTEPQGGADIENMDLLGGSTIRTTARRDGDDWVINGHKLWPTNSGGVADLFGVVCTTEAGSSDPRDFAFIFVPADAPGVTQSKPYPKAGMAADMNGDFWFEVVRVPAWYRAHGPGDDALYFKEVVAFGLLGSMAFASGVMLDLLRLLREFADTTRLRGRPLKENDDAAAVLADVVADAELIRISGYQFARMLDRPDLYGEPWSDQVVAPGRALKYAVCDRALASLGRAMDLMGEHGADRLCDVEKHWRDFKIVQLWMGGKQLCQMEAARWFYDCETL